MDRLPAPPLPGWLAQLLPPLTRYLLPVGGHRLHGMEIRAALGAGGRASIRGAVARAYRWPLRRIADRTAPLWLARMAPDRPDHPSVAALGRCQELVTSFRGPVAAVWGVRDPILGRVVNHLARLLPAARVVRTEAGHFLQEEVPDEIAAAVRWVLAP